MPDVKQLQGTQFQGWSLGSILGSGADGIVYAASKDGVDRAIKIFFPESLKVNGHIEAKERLDLQLSLVGQAPHPNLVNVYGGGEDDNHGTLFLVMDLVPGRTLDKVLSDLPVEDVPSLVAQLAVAAEFLEKQELYHRDIKPANIVISNDFKRLTLLDLGIVHQTPKDGDNDRLSGNEFIATLRYSPPEFVWRTEQSQEEGAWRAVTFYKIGATVHDMIMRVPLFSGMDQPRAKLYDCVRDHTPKLVADNLPSWLLRLTEACLLKDWRRRLQYVRWDSFCGPPNGADTIDRETIIALRQIRMEEARQARARQASVIPAPNREQDLWQLNSAFFMEMRAYLIGATIFPLFKTEEQTNSERHYVTKYTFEKNAGLGFLVELVVCVGIQVAEELDAATRLSFESFADGSSLVSATWTEMFTAETAFTLWKQALLDSVESVIPKE